MLGVLFLKNVLVRAGQRRSTYCIVLHCAALSSPMIDTSRRNDNIEVSCRSWWSMGIILVYSEAGGASDSASGADSSTGLSTDGDAEVMDGSDGPSSATAST